MGERSAYIQKLEDGRRNLILIAVSGWVAALLMFILGMVK